jgi:hypothetical protein
MTGMLCIFIALSGGSTEELNLDIPLERGDDNVMHLQSEEREIFSTFFTACAYYQLLCELIDHDSARGIYTIIVK